MDSWQDYLATLVGPAVLALQFGTIHWRRWPQAVLACLGAVIAFVAMIAVLAGATEAEDANIGVALLALEAVASLLLSLWGWLRHRGSSLA